MPTKVNLDGTVLTNGPTAKEATREPMYVLRSRVAGGGAEQESRVLREIYLLQLLTA
jgi:hypothetical protein